VTRIAARLVPAGDFLARFDPLAKAFGRVESEHLAKILDLGEQDRQAVVIQEAPRGKSLAELASGGEGLPMDRVLEIARQLGDTLAALHKRHLLLLSLDPQDAWLDEQGKVTLSNAGIPQGVNVGRLLASGKLEAGPWQAPELCQDEPGDSRTDFYSLGTLLYLTLTGKEADPNRMGDKTPTLTDLYPSHLRESLTPEWDDLVSRCIHPNPARRIQSAAEFMSKLEEVRIGMETAGELAATGKEDSLVGQTLGGYHLVEKLGQGGMATVYKAYESTLDRYVAVKVLPPFFAGDANFAQRFKREAKAVAHLSHPNIIPIYNFGEEKGITYIAMQLMQGGTLKHPRGEVYPAEEALRKLLPVLHALGYAHQRGIVHRDIKPSNILLTEDNWPVIADFGLVQMAEASARLTGSGVGLGTPAYMSPEQGQGGRVDQRSDIYSLGIVLYEMVTGDVPFHADTPMAVLLKHISEPMPQAHKANPNIPREVEAIILKATAKEPEKRFQSAEEMASAMEQALRNIAAGREKVTEKKTRFKAEAAPATKKAGKTTAERKSLTIPRPAWRLRPIYLIAGAAALVLALGGIFGPRLFANHGITTPPADTGLATWTANSSGVAPPTMTSGQISWSKVNDLEVLERDQVNAFAIDPHNLQVVYIGTQNSGVYKTNNDGQSWVSKSSGLGGAAISSLVMNPLDPNMLFATVYSRGVYRTTDGGNSWQLSQNNTSGMTWPDCSNLTMDTSYPKRLYFSDGKTLYHTEDWGISWYSIPTNLPEGVLCSLTIAYWDNTNLWASQWDGKFYISTDKGWTWNVWLPWGSLFPDHTTHVYNFWLDPYEDTGMYVSFRDNTTSEAYLLHSTDKGTTWTSNTLNCSNGMAFDPNDPQAEYCASGHLLFITKDGGEKWDVVKDFADERIFSLALSPRNSHSIYLGSGGVIHSQDEGTSWEYLEAGLGAGKYEFIENPADPSGLYLLSGNDDDGWILFKFNNEKGNFDKFVFDYPGYPSFGMDGEIYISKGTELWKYNPAEVHIDLISSLEISNPIHFVVYPFKQGVIYGTGDPGYFFWSNDWGANWDKVAVDTAGAGRIHFAESGSEAYFSTTENAAFSSMDWGISWARCGEIDAAIPDSGTALAIDERTADHDHYRIYMATRGKGLMISNDSCKTWTENVTAPFRSLNINSVVTDPNNANTVYVGTDAGAYVSYDIGRKWTEISEGLPVGGAVYSIIVREDGKVFAATPFGVFSHNIK